MQKYKSEVQMPESLKIVNQEMDSKIAEIESGSEDGLLKIRDCIQIVIQAVNKLRDYISDHKFENIQDEISFFKYIKPHFYSKYLFYIKIYQIQILRPTGAFEDEMNYILKEMKQLTTYFESNKSFY